MHYRKSYPNWIDRIKQGRATFSERRPDDSLSGAARGPERQHETPQNEDV